MFNRMKQKSWDDGSQWGIDTFAFIVEMEMTMGLSLQEAYDSAKKMMVNEKSLNSRLSAWKESNV